MSIKHRYIVNEKLLKIFKKRLRRMEERYRAYTHRRDATISYQYYLTCPVCHRPFKVGDSIICYGCGYRWIHVECYPKIFVDNEE